MERAPHAIEYCAHRGGSMHLAVIGLPGENVDDLRVPKPAGVTNSALPGRQGQKRKMDTNLPFLVFSVRIS